MRVLNISVACAFALAAMGAHADNAVIPASTFAKHSAYASAFLSPTGEYVSVVTPFEDRHGLSIIKLSGNYDRSMIKFGAKETISGAWWTDDTRLIVEKARDAGTLAVPVGTGEYYATDADGKNQTQLFGYIPDHNAIRSKLKDEGWASYMMRIEGSNGDALFSFTPWSGGRSDTHSSIYRVNTRTGSRKLIESINVSGGVDADTAGVPRFIDAQDVNGEPVLRYRPHSSDEAWQVVPKTLAGRTMSVWFFEKDNNHAIAEISDKGEPAQLYRIDMAAGTREKIAGNDQFEIASYDREGRDGPVFSVRYDAGQPKVDYLDPTSEAAKLHAGLMKLFPGQLVEFINYTKDDSKLLFYVFSDRHPGAYYIFDFKTRQPQLLFEVMDWIDPAKMAPTRPVTFKNASGETLYGFYTAPLGKQGPMPMIVMPHGGPFGIHDSWSYDADVQFLASRGYAVMQVNFRGSGGRGENFERSTYRQWGTGIQDDIADSVKWAVAQGLADGKRVCIYGASFGGYSALMEPIHNPELYRCAIGYAGVYDLGEMYKSGDTNDTKQGRSYLARAVGEDPDALDAQSPDKQVERLNVPVLLIHGKNDWRAPIDQFNLMESALKKSGKTYETLVKANEGHGFYDEKNQTEAYERMAAFLAKYNPAN